MSSKKEALPYQDIDGFRIPAAFSADAYRSALQYQPHDDDIFIVTYPKCGTTWMQTIVTTILKDGERPFDSGLEFMTQSPFLEMVGAEAVEKMHRPGAIKTHLPFRLIPWSDKAKYIVVARNPKDACVSFYEYNVQLPMSRFADGKFSHFFELFVEGRTDFGDFFEMLLSWYGQRHRPNVLFSTFEAMKADPAAAIRRVAEFLGPRYKEKMSDPETVSKAVHHSSFTYLKDYLTGCFTELAASAKSWREDDPTIPNGLRAVFSNGDSSLFSQDSQQNQFFRKGTVGDWKNYFTPDQDERLMKRFREKTAGTDLQEIWKDVM